MIKVLGYGKAVASSRYLNDDMKQFIDTSDEWISSRTGIKSRYFSFDKNTSELATIAAKNAIIDSGLEKEKIDYIIVATMTPDKVTPSTAALVQKALGIEKSELMVFDVNVACSGFVNALDIAVKQLNEGQHALVIGAEVISKILDFSDRNTCCLFGDGAGAVVIKKNGTKEYQSYFNNYIDDKEVLYANGLGLAKEIADDYYLKMNGKQVFKFAIKACSDSVREVCAKAELDIADIDLIVPHQANYRIIKSTAKDLELPLEKFFLNLDKYGNTSAASIPLALAELKEQDLLKENMKIVLVAFGAGLSMGSILMEL